MLLLAIVVALMVSGCRPQEEGMARKPALPTAGVRVQVIKAVKHTATEDVVGTVRARLQARIEAKIAGRIQELRVAPGQPVKKGELLLRLDAQEIRARFDQAQAVAEQAGRDLQRITTLLKQAAVTQAEADAVQARSRVADGALNEAKTMLGYTGVSAPFDGVVTRKLADVGDLAAPGKPLLEVEDQTRLRIECDVPEAIIDRVKPGATMTARISGVSNELQVVAGEIAPSADSNSRTLRVKLEIPAAQGLRVGQFGRVAVPVSETASLRVPTHGLVKRGQMEMVFVVENQKAAMRLVRCGKTLGGEVEVVAGLAAGDIVVVDGAAGLVDGQPLEIKP